MQRPLPFQTSAYTPHHTPSSARRGGAVGLDLILSAVFVFGEMCVLIPWVNSLNPSGLPFALQLAINVLPNTLWFGLVLALARRGQTFGLVLCGLRWIDPKGDTAHWRPAGEPSFWCAIVAGLALAVPALVVGAIMFLNWLLWKWGGWRWGFPDLSAAPPVALVMLLVAGVIGWRARRHPAQLLRVSR